jgi:hypothetical protein
MMKKRAFIPFVFFSSSLLVSLCFRVLHSRVYVLLLLVYCFLWGLVLCVDSLLLCLYFLFER